MMLGIADPWVFAAYLLSIGAAVLCVVYGAAKWNTGDAAVEPQDVMWATHEQKQVTEEEE